VKRIAFALFLTVAPLGATVFAAENPAAITGDPVAGKTVFNKCSQCHQVGPSAQNATGPVLNGIIGQKAGVVPNYNFSEPMKNSGIVWDQSTLHPFLKSPRKAVPGTKMAFPGLPKDVDIDNVIAYLATFDISGNTVTPGTTGAADPAAPAAAPAQ
jgi:cytochrome c